MASLRQLRWTIPRTDFICSRCIRFSTIAAAQSGHSRWSKIKHDKGAVDRKRGSQNTIYSHEIALASKLHGADPGTNPRLANALAAAKKGGFPKANMEAAIARGQGRSASGAALEPIMVEVIIPPTQVALIIDGQTDNVNRTMMELRVIVRDHDVVVTPTSYLFQKRGRILFEKDERNLGVDEVLDEAIEAGADDVEVDEEGNLVVWTEPAGATKAAHALLKSKGLKVQSSDIIWDPNEETKVPMDDEDFVRRVIELVDALRDNANVQGVYANVAQGSLEDSLWEELESRFDS